VERRAVDCMSGKMLGSDRMPGNGWSGGIDEIFESKHSHHPEIVDVAVAAAAAVSSSGDIVAAVDNSPRNQHYIHC